MAKLQTIFLGAILIILSACGEKPYTNGPKPPTWAIEQDFQTYVDEFLVEANARGIYPARNLVVLMKDRFTYSTGPNSVAYCVYPNRDFAYPLIEVKKAYWDAIDDDTRRQMIFHELGHCLLLRGHNTDSAFVPSLNRSVPLSIMNPWIISSFGPQVESFYLNNLVAYLEELFDPLMIASLRTLANNSISTPEENLNTISTTDTQPLNIGGMAEFGADGSCHHTHDTEEAH